MMQKREEDTEREGGIRLENEKSAEEST